MEKVAQGYSKVNATGVTPFSHFITHFMNHFIGHFMGLFHPFLLFTLIGENEFISADIMNAVNERAVTHPA